MNNINYRQVYEEELTHTIKESLEKPRFFADLSHQERMMIEELIDIGYKRAISDALDAEVLSETAALAGEMGTQHGLDQYKLKPMPTVDLEIYTHPKFKNSYFSIEGKYALIVYIVFNKLKQVIGYRVLIEGREMFCKAKVAHNHFELVETKTDESGGSSTI